jgi:hypothetical protein
VLCFLPERALLHLQYSEQRGEQRADGRDRSERKCAAERICIASEVVYEFNEKAGERRWV